MDTVAQCAPAKRKDERIILHFDMDCFYASVFEVANPALRTLPLAVQQKHIIVTCNYEARRRGLYKMQLVTEARRICPDVIVMLGEDLTPFRDASKSLYAYLQSFSWNQRLEKLGFDEIFMDVSDMVDYNVQLLNRNDLEHSWFCLDRLDPIKGFAFDARKHCGPAYPPQASAQLDAEDPPLSPVASPLTTSPRHRHHHERTLRIRLILGSWLAQHLRHCLEEHTGHTATVGISTNKLLSKLVGNVNKPKSQTVLLPPYVSTGNSETSLPSNVTTFLSMHDISKITGIGFKTSQKIRDHVLSSPAPQARPYSHPDTHPSVTVQSLLSTPSLSPTTLERILSAPGTPRGIGLSVWNLLHGIDDAEVKEARPLPSQISIEDSYLSLTTLAQISRELRALSTALLARMRTDLVVDAKWLAFPRTLRLSTRLRGDREARSRLSSRTSRSCPLPGFVFGLGDHVEGLAGRLVDEALMGLFKRLHGRSGWDLSLMNVAVTNFDTSESLKGTADIGALFKREKTLEWDVEDRDVPPDAPDPRGGGVSDGVDVEDVEAAQHVDDALQVRDAQIPDSAEPSAGCDAAPLLDTWLDDDVGESYGFRCADCGATILPFAASAHARFHALLGAG